MEPLTIRPGLEIPARELSWSAVRASGPGGQNVNRVATRVALRFDLPRDTVLSEAAKARLRAREARRLDGDGALVVTSQATRSQASNLDDARRKLAASIRAALRAPRSRKATRRTAGSERRRLGDKRRLSEKKQLRRPPRGD